MDVAERGSSNKPNVDGKEKKVYKGLSGWDGFVYVEGIPVLV